MRKVKVKVWIPVEFPAGSNSANCQTTHRALPNTNCWSKDFICNGLFHGWFAAYTEFESGPGNYSIAIVELPDGTIIEVLPSNLKFETVKS